MKSRNTSVAGSVAHQAKTHAELTNRVVDLDSARLALTRLDHEVDPQSGARFLKAIFPRHDAPDEILDLSFLTKFPNLEAPLAEGFRLWGSSVSSRTRGPRVEALASGLCAFLMEVKREAIAMLDLDESFFRAFVRWLDRPNAVKNDQPLAVGTRAIRLGVVRSLFERLAESSQWQQASRVVLAAIPYNPWPGRSKKIEPRERLDRDHLQTIVAAAESEVLTIASRWKEGRSLLQIGHRGLSLGVRDYRNLAICLAEVDRLYPSIIPDRTVIQQTNPSLQRAIQTVHGQNTVARHFYASSRDLVPFAILLSVATAFNVETVLSLEQNGIVHSELFGIPIIRITGSKGRASENPSKALDGSEDDEGVSASMVLKLLEKMTERIRPAIMDARDRSKLFVFVQTKSVKKPKAFRTEHTGASADVAWTGALANFIATHELEPFTLGQIRKTVLDEHHLRTGDLLLTAQLAQHRSPNTLWQHYTSDGTRQRYQERLGEVLVLRERWRQTDGVIDPRTRHLASDMDRGAATPGFLCLDPYDSPRPNQTKGRLCAAYGECPSCPMAAADIGNAASVALYRALRQAIYDAQGRVTPMSWTLRWAPILIDIDSLIGLVPEATATAAASYRIELPAVG